MGGVEVEYVEAFDVCVLRVWGHVSAAAICAAVVKAVTRHRRSKYLWDVSEVALEDWPRERVEAIVRKLRPIATALPPVRVVLVGARLEVAELCAVVRDLMAEYDYPVETRVFTTRLRALGWLGVMNIPVGRASGRR